MFEEFYDNDDFAFVMAVSALYDKEMSNKEIASMLDVDEGLVQEALITICMARENYWTRISRKIGP